MAGGKFLEETLNPHPRGRGWKALAMKRKASCPRSLARDFPAGATGFEDGKVVTDLQDTAAKDLTQDEQESGSLSAGTAAIVFQSGIRRCLRAKLVVGERVARRLAALLTQTYEKRIAFVPR